MGGVVGGAQLGSPEGPGAQRANEGLSRGPGGLGSLTKEALWGKFSVFRRVRSELLGPISGLLDPI